MRIQNYYKNGGAQNFVQNHILHNETNDKDSNNNNSEKGPDKS
jgi:hypothetical protein